MDIIYILYLYEFNNDLSKATFDIIIVCIRSYVHSKYIVHIICAYTLLLNLVFIILKNYFVI